MSKKIIAFGASNSKKSINKRLASYCALQFNELTSEVLDLNDFEMPIYSIDRELNEGIPEQALAFKQLIRGCDGIIISFAEHNGAYTAAYKNIYDWISRIEKNVWLDKPMLLMGTSPGGRGAKGVLDLAFNSYSRSNENVLGKFSLPSFNDNFSDEEGIKDPQLKAELEKLLHDFNAMIGA